MKNLLPGFVVLTALAGSLVACENEESGDTVSISATLDSAYSVAYAPTVFDNIKSLFLVNDAMALASDTTVNKIVAIPTYLGSYGPAMLQYMVQADIAADGSFRLTLDKSYEWVLLLVNTAAASKAELVVGYVAAKVDDDNSLIAYSGNQLISDLNLGTLYASGEEALSSTSGQENAAAFSFSLEDMKTLARADNGFKHLINLFLNYSPTNTYSIQPDFGWEAGSIADSTATPTAAAIDAIPTPTYTLTTEAAWYQNPVNEDICSAEDTITLFPPSLVTNGTDFWDAANGLTNSCPGSSDKLIGFGERLLIQAGGLPEGMWRLNFQGETIAEFDLAIGSPVNRNLKYDTIPLPALKVNADPATGAISSLEISWFLFDPASGEYLGMTEAQITAVEQSYMVRDTFISVADEDGPNPADTPYQVNFRPEGTDPMGYDNALATSFDMSQGAVTWYLPGSAGDVVGNHVPTHIRLGLHMGGALHSFSWH